jgi:hypothetical protein
MNLNFWENVLGVNFNPMGRYVDEFKLMYPKETSLWGKKEAVWVDTADIWKLFVEIPELRAVINKRASMMSSNVPCLYDKNGEKVEAHWLLDLIRKPNAIQSWADVVYTLSVQDALYSNVFAYSPVRSFNVRNLLVPLPANKVKIHTTGKRLKQMDANDLIDRFTFQYDDQKLESIDWADMLYLTTDDGMNLIKPISRIETLKFPLSNIRASYHKRNVLLENIGAIGILSAEKNDLGGPLPMTPEEKNQIQRDWFRRQRDDLIITEAKVNWTPMSFPTRDLMLFEELTEDKLAIIDAFGLNYNLFSSTTGATYSNVKDSIRMVYQDTIIPETQAMYNSMIKQFGLDEEGYYLEAEFDHLAVMQHDEKATAETQKIKVETLEKIMAMGINVDEDTIKNFIRFYE